MGTTHAANRRGLGRCNYGDQVKLDAGPCPFYVLGSGVTIEHL
jgi:hypothetical protein